MLSVIQELLDQVIAGCAACAAQLRHKRLTTARRRAELATRGDMIGTGLYFVRRNFFVTAMHVADDRKTGELSRNLVIMRATPEVL